VRLQGTVTAMKTRIYLRQPTLADARAFQAAVAGSRSLHHPWVKPPQTRVEFQAYLTRMALPGNRAFLVCETDTDALAGVINISNIVGGLFRSGYLGYYAFAGHERQGHMHEGLQGVIRHAFRTLKLHRLEANIQPGNVASLALVASCGFAREGYSPRYLKIGGRWRDHERWAVLAS